MDGIRTYFLELRQNSETFPRTAPKVQISAGCGLLIVALFCFARHPAAPVRVSSRRTAPSVDRRAAVGDIFTLDSDNIDGPHRIVTPFTSQESIESRHAFFPVSFSFLGDFWRSIWAGARTGESANLRPLEYDDVDGSQANASLTESIANALDPLKSFIEETYDGYAIVSSRAGIDEVAGIALLFHGCGQSARDWYELPEHRQVVRQLQASQILPVSFSASNSASGCWSTRFPAGKNEDALRVIRSFAWFSNQHSLPPRLLRYGVGISSGGTFLSILSGSDDMPPISTQVLYISPGSMRAFRHASEEYPNTLFVHLRNDIEYASHRAVSDGRRALLMRGVKLVGEMSQKAVPLRPLTMHSRDPRLSQTTSKYLFNVLMSCRVGKGNGNTAGDYTDTLRGRGTCQEADILRIHENIHQLRELREGGPVASRSLRQLVRVLNGQHELSSSSSDKVVRWLKGHPRHRQSR
jgi:hypothetical protein